MVVHFELYKLQGLIILMLFLFKILKLECYEFYQKTFLNTPNEKNQFNYSTDILLHLWSIVAK